MRHLVPRLARPLLVGALLSSLSSYALAVPANFLFTVDRLDNDGSNTLGFGDGVVHYIGAGVTPNTAFGTTVMIEQGGTTLPMTWWSSHVSPNEYYARVPVNVGTSAPWTVVAG